MHIASAFISPHNQIRFLRYFLWRTHILANSFLPKLSFTLAMQHIETSTSHYRLTAPNQQYEIFTHFYLQLKVHDSVVSVFGSLLWCSEFDSPTGLYAVFLSKTLYFSLFQFIQRQKWVAMWLMPSCIIHWLFIGQTWWHLEGMLVCMSDWWPSRNNGNNFTQTSVLKGNFLAAKL